MRSKLISTAGIGALIGGGSDGEAATSSTTSTEAAKPKANDISHLIKRKKPETVAADEGSSVTDSAPPAKKPAP